MSAMSAASRLLGLLAGTGVFWSLATVVAAETPLSCSTEGCEEDKVNLLHLKGKEEWWRKRGDDWEYEVTRVNAHENNLLKKQVKVSLSIGSGGNSGMSTAVGAYRALLRLGLLDNVDQLIESNGYVGGPLLYAKGRSFEDLLGAPTEPQDLTLAALQAQPQSQILQVTTKPVLATLLSLNAVAPADLPTNEVFTISQAINYLCPFELNGALPPPFNLPNGAIQVPPVPPPFDGLAGFPVCSNTNEDQVWALDEEHLQRLRRENPQQDFTGSLTIQRTNIKSYVLNGRLIAPEGYLPQLAGRPLFWLSPDQCGVPFYFWEQNLDFVPINASTTPPLENIVIGGGLVDSVACLSTEAPRTHRAQAGFSKRTYSPLAEDTSILTLQSAVGLAANDLDQAIIVGNEDFIQDVANLVALAGRAFDPSGPDKFPVSIRRPYWPVGSKKRGNVKKRDWVVGGFAGQTINGLSRAILSGASCLLQFDAGFFIPRGSSRFGRDAAPNISDFLDCSTPTPTITNQTKFDIYRNEGPIVSSSSFGFSTDTEGFAALPNPNNLPDQYFNIFSQDQYVPLLCEFVKNYENTGNVYASVDLTTVENKYLGIEAGKKIHVLFIGFDKFPDFEAELPADTQAAINSGIFSNGETGLDGWPKFESTFPNGPQNDPVALAPAQASLLAAQREWQVLQLQEEIEACMAKEPMKPKKNGYYNSRFRRGFRKGFWRRR